MASRPQKPLNREAAETVAVTALAFLAERPEALGRFLALAGIGPVMLRQAAQDPAFLMGVIDFLMSEEPLLIAFADHAGLRPEQVAAVGRILADAT